MAVEFTDNSKIVDPFSVCLSRSGHSLVREKTRILQVNLGRLCNLSCRHCHLEAGPSAGEVMGETVAGQVVKLVEGNDLETVDFTGGAPELNPNLPFLIQGTAQFSKRIIVRSNLTLPAEPEYHRLLDLFGKHRVTVVGSLPSMNASQTDGQRGEGVFNKIIAGLKALNERGYGLDPDYELNLVSNPAGAFMPPPQMQQESRFRSDLQRKYGIRFNNLYVFANVPLGRFRSWLISSGNYVNYVQKLASGFQACNLNSLMCRSMVSVAWDGQLYDCDFNLAVGLPLSGTQKNISSVKSLPGPGDPIAVTDHCYACTAGSGFT